MISFLHNFSGGNMKKILTIILGSVLVLGFMTVSAKAAKTLKCQTVLNAKSDEARLLKEEFTDRVTELTGGSLNFEILPARYSCRR